MSRILRTLLQNVNHGPGVLKRQCLRTLVKEGDTKWHHLLEKRSPHLTYKWCSDCSSPWGVQTRQDKTDNDEPTSPHNSIPRPISHVMYGSYGTSNHTLADDHSEELCLASEKSDPSENLYMGRGNSNWTENFNTRSAKSHPPEDFYTRDNKLPEDFYTRDGKFNSTEAIYTGEGKSNLTENIYTRGGKYRQTKDLYTNGDKEDYISQPTSVHTPDDCSELSEPTNTDNILPSQRERQHLDLLLRRIRECRMSEEVFSLQHRHKEVMGIKHTLLAMEKLAEFVTSGSEKASHVRDNDDFRELGLHLFKLSRRLNIEEVPRALKHLSRLQVPADSKLVQIMLQMLRHQINDLDLAQIVFLEFLVKKFEPHTPLAAALITAFPVLIDARLPQHQQQLSDLGLPHVSRLLNIMVNGRGQQCGVLVAEMFRRCDDLQQPQIAISVAWNLVDLTASSHSRKSLTPKERANRNQLLSHCLGVLADDTHSVPYKQMNALLKKLSHACTQRRDRSCRHQPFLHAMTQRALGCRLDFTDTALLLTRLLNMQYQCDELVRHLVSEVVRNPGVVGSGVEVSIVSLLDCLATCTLPIPSTHLMQAIDALMFSPASQLDGESYYRAPLLRMALNLLSLNHYHPKLMSLLMNPDTLSMYMSQFPSHHRQHLRLLEVHQALTLLLKTSQAIPDSFLAHGREIVAHLPPSRSSLTPMLREIVAEGCLVSGVVTGDDLYLDHLLVLDSSGCPIPLTPPPELRQNISIETLNIPEGFTRLAVLDVGSSNTYDPGHKLWGPMRLRKRVLEAAGYTVLMVLQAELYALHQDEKIFYVAQELRRAGVFLRDVPQTHSAHTAKQPFIPQHTSPHAPHTYNMDNPSI